jgi:hypothetical protein
MDVADLAAPASDALDRAGGFRAMHLGPGSHPISISLTFSAPLLRGLTKYRSIDDCADGRKGDIVRPPRRCLRAVRSSKSGPVE